VGAVERVADRVRELADEPAAPALLHGDLWAGNVLTHGDRLTALLDPALYRGHPEVDLAFATMFGGFPDRFFHAPRVTAVSRERREAFPFDEPLFAQVEEEGLGGLDGIGEVRETAEQIARDRALSGLSPVRLGAASASEIYRYTRTEGHVVALGLSVNAHPSADLHLRGGWAFGRKEPVATVEFVEAEAGSWRVEGYLNRPTPIEPLPATSGVVNTLGALLFDEDWTDPYLASGGRIALQRQSSPLPGGVRLEASVRLQRERSTRVVLDDGARFRPAPEVEEGELLAVEVAHDWGGAVDPDDGWGARLRLLQGLDVGSTDFDHTRILTTIAWSGAHPWHDLDLGARLDAGWVSADAPPQALFLLGGRGTLLGHPTHGFEGDRFWLLRADVRRGLVEPFVGARLFAAAGQAECRSIEPRLGRDPRAGVRASLGAGLALLWNVVHLDWGYGLDGGSGEGALSVVEVHSGKTRYRVRLLEDGARCTCPWFAKHRGARGPCKHVLAAQLVLEREEPRP